MVGGRSRVNAKSRVPIRGAHPYERVAVAGTGGLAV